MSKVTSFSVLAYLRNLVLARKEQWIKKTLATTKGGSPTDPGKANAECFCLIGGTEQAIIELGVERSSKEFSNLRNQTLATIEAAIYDKPVGTLNETNVWLWNDDDKREFGDVQGIIVKAGKLAA